MFRSRLPVITAALFVVLAFAGCLGSEADPETGPTEVTEVAEGASVSKFIFESDKFSVSGTIEKHTETDTKDDNILCSLGQCSPSTYWWYTWSIEGLAPLGSEEEPGELSYQLWLARPDSGWARASNGQSFAPNGTMEGQTSKSRAQKDGEYTRALLTIESKEDATEELLIFEVDGLEVGSPVSVSDAQPFDGVIGDGKLEPTDSGQFNISLVAYGLPDIDPMKYTVWLESTATETPTALGTLVEDATSGGQVFSGKVTEDQLKGWKVFISVESPDEGAPEFSSLTVLRSKFVK